MPYDVGRLPTNVFDHSDGGFGGITADQWKLYILSYARPCLYKLLANDQYRCIVKLSEIVVIITSPILTQDQIAVLFRSLHDHHLRFQQLYGKWAVTVNYHMSLHLPDTILDLGPPQSFWCFAYERLNGFLAGTPNSHRNIEVDVLDRFLRDVSCCNSDLPALNISKIPRTMRCPQ